MRTLHARIYHRIHHPIHRGIRTTLAAAAVWSCSPRADAQLLETTIPSDALLIDATGDLGAVLLTPNTPPINSNAIWKSSTGVVGIGGVSEAVGISNTGRFVAIQSAASGPQIWSSGSGVLNIPAPPTGTNPRIYDVEEISGGSARVCGRATFGSGAASTQGVIWTFNLSPTPIQSAIETFRLRDPNTSAFVSTRITSMSRTGRQLGGDTVGFGKVYGTWDLDRGFTRSFAGADNTAGFIKLSALGNAGLAREGSTSINALRVPTNTGSPQDVSFGNFTVPSAISADGGVVIGNDFAGPGATGATTPVIWTRASGTTRRLIDLLNENGTITTGWVLETAQLLSDDGQRVMGKGTLNGNPVVYQATVFGVCGDQDCNRNARGDICDIALGSSRDCDQNNIPDECQLLSPQTTNFDNGTSAPWRTSGACRKVGGAIQLTQGTTGTKGSLTLEPFQRRLLKYLRIQFDFKMSGTNLAKGIGVYAYDASRYPIDAVFNDDGPGVGSIGVKLDPYDGALNLTNRISVVVNGVRLGNTAPAGFNMADGVRRRGEVVISPGSIVFRIETSPGNWQDLLTLASDAIPANLIPRVGFGSEKSGTSPLAEVDNVTIFRPNGLDANADGLLDNCGGGDTFTVTGGINDCNENLRDDASDFALKASDDCDINSVPDECQATTPLTFGFGGGTTNWQFNGSASQTGGEVNLTFLGLPNNFGTAVHPPVNTRSETRFAHVEFDFRLTGTLNGEGVGMYLLDASRYPQGALFDDDGPGAGSTGIKVFAVNPSFSALSVVHDGRVIGTRFFENNLLDGAMRHVKYVLTGRTVEVEMRRTDTVSVALFANTVLPTSMSAGPFLPPTRTGFGARIVSGCTQVIDNATLWVPSPSDANNNGILDSCPAGIIMPQYPQQRPRFNTADGVPEIDPILPCDDMDFDNDGAPATALDVAAIVDVVSGDVCEACDDADINQDGVTPDVADLEAYLLVLAGGC